MEENQARDDERDYRDLEYFTHNPRATSHDTTNADVPQLNLSEETYIDEEERTPSLRTSRSRIHVNESNVERILRTVPRDEAVQAIITTIRDLRRELHEAQDRLYTIETRIATPVSPDDLDEPTRGRYRRQHIEELENSNRELMEEAQSATQRNLSLYTERGLLRAENENLRHDMSLLMAGLNVEMPSMQLRDIAVHALERDRLHQQVTRAHETANTLPEHIEASRQFQGTADEVNISYMNDLMDLMTFVRRDGRQGDGQPDFIALVRNNTQLADHIFGTNSEPSENLEDDSPIGSPPPLEPISDTESIDMPQEQLLEITITETILDRRRRINERRRYTQGATLQRSVPQRAIRANETIPASPAETSQGTQDDRQWWGSYELRAMEQVASVEQIGRAYRTTIRPQGTAKQRPSPQGWTFSMYMKINDLEAWVLLDTGSTINAISPELTRISGVSPFELSNPINLQLGAVGSRSKANFGVKTKLRVANDIHTVYFDVVNVPKYDLVLGIPFMHATKMVIDFGTYTVKIGNTVLPALKGEGISPRAVIKAPGPRKPRPSTNAEQPREEVGCPKARQARE